MQCSCTCVCFVIICRLSLLPSICRSWHCAVWRVNVGTDAVGTGSRVPPQESQCCLLQSPSSHPWLLLLACLCCCCCCCCCFSCCGHCSLPSIWDPLFPQTAPRHVHMYWAAMPIAWCLELPVMPPGLSLQVSTRLLGISPAHVHAL